MIRGWLLQRPKRRAACLLCCYRQRPLGSALRAYYQDASQPQFIPSHQAKTTGPTPGQLTGNAAGFGSAGPSWGGGLGPSTPATGTPTWGASPILAHSKSGSSTPGNNDGLFPHERLARERSLARNAKEPEVASKDTPRRVRNQRPSKSNGPQRHTTFDSIPTSSVPPQPRTFGAPRRSRDNPGLLEIAQKQKRPGTATGEWSRPQALDSQTANNPSRNFADTLTGRSLRSSEKLFALDSSKQKNTTPRGSDPLRGFGGNQDWEWDTELGGPENKQLTSRKTRDEFWERAKERANDRVPDRAPDPARKRGLDDLPTLASPSKTGATKATPRSGFDLLEKLGSARKTSGTKATQKSDSWDWADAYLESKNSAVRRTNSNSERPRLGQGLSDGLKRGSWRRDGARRNPDLGEARFSYGSQLSSVEVEPFLREPSPTMLPSREVGREVSPKVGGARDTPFRKKDRESRHGMERETKSKKNQRKQSRARDEDDDFDDESYEERRRRRLERKKEKERARREAEPIPILLPELISVANLGAALGIKSNIFLQQLEELGFEDISKDSILTGETAALVAQEYGFEPSVEIGEDQDLKPRPPPEDSSTVPVRPPVVTIMGHVDHGKTTLLDFLRKSSIVSQEHGGITQHIGAFSVEMSTGKRITFLDTPGHAAFLSMRQRGANVTDMVILVVAADDSVKPQTLEALKHVRAANVPMIVAINKVDKDSANIDRVKSDLAANGVEIEDFGGDVQVVCVSGKTGQGMADLEENILLLADMLDIRAESDGMAEGWVLESSIKPIGRVATVLVKRGTLRPGDFIVAGTAFAKIRSLRNEAGQDVDEAPPGTAVEILGWKDEPHAGDQVLQAPNEDKAKTAIHYREELKERHDAVLQQAQLDQERREREAAEAAAKAAEENGGKAENSAPGTKLVNFTIKGDVHGSVEAVCAAVLEIGNNEVRTRVLQSAPGLITEWDIEHAATSGSTILNFNNPVPGHIKALADASGVKILEHNVIYHLTEEVREILSGYLAPIIKTKVLAEAEILQVFPINLKGRKYQNVAGCKVRNGQVTRNARIRVMRNGEQVFEGNIESLKQGKREATEIKKGSECGIMVDSEWDDFQVGDFIQTLEEIRETRRL